MPFYKDPFGRVHHLDDASFEHLLPAGCVAISDAEAAALQAPAPTPAQVVASYSAAVQSHLDAAARAAGYDNINTVVSYAGEPAVAKFQVEGAAFRAWRSLCWAYCYAQLAAVEAQERTQPTIEELITELPSLVLS